MFGEVKLTKNVVDVDQYKYLGYGIGLDRKGSYSIGNEVGRNVINFVVDMRSSPYIDNKNKYILILNKGPAQGLKHTLTAEKLYSITFTKENTKFCLRLHCNGANSYFFFLQKLWVKKLMVQKLLNLKQKTQKLLHIHST